MAVKSKVIENMSKKETKFPVLKMLKDCGDVVMFITRGKGTVVVGRTYSLGHCSDIWIDCDNKTLWEDFDGKVVLSNEM